MFGEMWWTCHVDARAVYVMAGVGKGVRLMQHCHDAHVAAAIVISQHAASSSSSSNYQIKP
jgi:hypothetical protein